MTPNQAGAGIDCEAGKVDFGLCNDMYYPYPSSIFFFFKFLSPFEMKKKTKRKHLLGERNSSTPCILDPTYLHFNLLISTCGI